MDVDNDLETVKRERNELQATLNKFERNVLEVICMFMYIYKLVRQEQPLPLEFVEWRERI